MLISEKKNHKHLHGGGHQMCLIWALPDGSVSVLRERLSVSPFMFLTLGDNLPLFLNKSG